MKDMCIALAAAGSPEGQMERIKCEVTEEGANMYTVINHAVIPEKHKDP